LVLLHQLHSVPRHQHSVQQQRHRHLVALGRQLQLHSVTVFNDLSVADIDILCVSTRQGSVQQPPPPIPLVALQRQLHLVPQHLHLVRLHRTQIHLVVVRVMHSVRRNLLLVPQLRRHLVAEGSLVLRSQPVQHLLVPQLLADLAPRRHPSVHRPLVDLVPQDKEALVNQNTQKLRSGFLPF
jgi:hypothetical protein